MANDQKSNPAGSGEKITVTSASAGQKTGHIRWVLAIGTTLAIVGMLLVWTLATHH